MRHVVSLSGGKDSTALAIYLRDKIPNLEYVFCDTGKELPETYDYLDKLESYLQKPIIRLKPVLSFDELLEMRGGFLPSFRVRWCTIDLKIKPFESYIGDDFCYMYVGIRADEADRVKYLPKKPNIIPKYPFIEDGLVKEDILRIIKESDLGLPDYYRWRSRSGCYFCFFQRKSEFLNLAVVHPDLFEKAANYEKTDESSDKKFTWLSKTSLRDLTSKNDLGKIKESLLLTNNYFDDDPAGCVVCHL